MGSTAVDDQTGDNEYVTEHFKPTGTIFVLGLFVATTILLWASVYLILLNRGVTV